MVAVCLGVWWWCILVVTVIDHACSLVKKKKSLVEQKKNLPEAQDVSMSRASTAAAVIAVGGPSCWW